MRIKSRIHSYGRQGLLHLSLVSIVLVSTSVPARAQTGTLALSDVPLFLLESVAPNLAITFDDSGSMLWGYLPDAIQWDDQAADLADRAATKSNYYNKMYYDPNVDYRPGLNAAGASLGEADFNAALTNIYNYNQDGYNNTWRPVSVNLASNFRPVWNPSRYSSWGPRYSGDGFGPAYYFNRDDTRPGCNGSDLDNDCYVQVTVSASSGPARPRPEFGWAVSTDERTNFANWYQYYSYRFIAGKTVLSRAFAPENLSSSVRVARQTINRRTLRSGNPGSSNSSGTPYVAAFDSTQRTHFYNWLFNIGAAGGTELRAATAAAGQYFTTSGTDSPYSVSPGTGGAEQISCRLNSHILLSDGYWNGWDIGGIDRDQTTKTLPDGTSYNPSSGDHNIYAHSEGSQSLADVAFHYWANDLSSLDNNVAPYYPDTTGDAVADYWNPANDPANWQHMVNYPIAFGIAGQVPLTETVYDSLLNGTAFTNETGVSQTGWTTVDINEGRADDMYHAAINSRGKFFSASKPDELVNSLVSVMNAIADRESSAAAVDLNSSSITAGVGVYQARFFTDNWAGDISARPISDGSGIDTCNSAPIGTVCTAVWNAAERNTVDTLFTGGTDGRIVFTANPAQSLGDRGTVFKWSSLTAAQRAFIQNGDSLSIARSRLKYLRGSEANEEKNGGIFRTRPDSRVGAVVHSSPQYVGNGFDQGGNFETLYPDDLESGSRTYKDFICANATDTNNDGKIDSCSSGVARDRIPIVYVGSNDGMVHAYDARLFDADGTVTPTGGDELFSFVPPSVIKNLHELSNPTFTTGAYVDGELASSDVYYGNDWHTVLIGGLRTGGQAYYALDVTEASDISSQNTAFAEQLFRWEFTDNNTSGLSDGAAGVNGDRDLGYTFGAPEIVKLNYTGGGSNTGRWVAIFGNGYNATFSDSSASTTGNAVLYIVDIETGLLIKKIDTGVGSVTNPNGIAGIAPILNDSDLTVDYVYAGDLYGNLWKFDVSSSNPAHWGSAYTSGRSSTPLFEAKIGSTAQPIQSTPRVSRHFLGGNLVYFGTGKYLEDSDNADTSQQSFYGIWDKDECRSGGDTISCTEIPAGDAKNHQSNSVARGSLQGQSISLDTNDVRTSTENQVNWSNQNGWYLDFPTNEGERMISTPVLRGEVVIFTTLEPDDSVCDSGGSSWIYALDRVDGGKPPIQVFDHNGDGEINNDDYVGGGASTAAHIDAVISSPAYAEGKDGKDYIIYGSSDLAGADGGVGTAATPDTTIEGRVRWRQLN